MPVGAAATVPVGTMMAALILVCARVFYRFKHCNQLGNINVERDRGCWLCRIECNEAGAARLHAAPWARLPIDVMMVRVDVTDRETFFEIV